MAVFNSPFKNKAPFGDDNLPEPKTFGAQPDSPFQHPDTVQKQTFDPDTNEPAPASSAAPKKFGDTKKVGGDGGDGGGGGHRYDLKATPTDYEADVLSGKYLDLENNPYMQDYIDAIKRDAEEELQFASGQLASPFAGAGATMGMTGIHAAQQGRLASEWGEDVQDTIAGVYKETYETERMLQNQIAGIVSGRSQAMIGAQATLDAASKALQAAKAQANAVKYSANLSFKMGQDVLAQQGMFAYAQLQIQIDQLSTATQKLVNDTLSGWSQKNVNYTG